MGLSVDETRDVVDEAAGRRIARRGFWRTPQLSGWIVLVIVILLIIPPLVLVWKQAFVSGGHLTSRAFSDMLKTPNLVKELVNTAIYSLGSAMWAILLGGTVAWIIERSQTRLRSLVYATAFITFAFPGVLMAVGWILLAGGRTGSMNGWIHDLRIPLSVNIFSMWGMIFVGGLMWAPVAVQLMGITFQHMDPQLEESAVMSGASFIKRIFHITLPMGIPSLAAIGLLVTIWNFQSFEVPELIGLPSKIVLIPVAISNSITYNMPPDYTQASAYGVMISAFVIVVIFLYRYLLRQSDRFVTVGGKGYRPKPVDIGKWQLFADGLCWLFIALEIIVPVYLLVISFLPGFGLHNPLSKVSFGNYISVLGTSGVGAAFRDSLVIALTTAVVTVLLGFMVSWVVLRSGFRLRGLVDYLANMPLAVTGVVLGLAVLELGDTVLSSLNGTIWIMVLAYTIGFLPYALRYTTSGLIQISRELEEGGLTNGASRIQVFVEILLPLLAPALAGVGVFIFLISIKELAISALLYTPNSQVMSTFILSLWNNGDIGQVTALGSMLAVVSLVLAYVALKLLAPDKNLKS